MTPVVPRSRAQISRRTRGAGSAAMAAARKPSVYADAAYRILTSPSRQCTGNQVLCEDVLLAHGVTDLSVYDVVPGGDLQVDLYVDEVNPPGYGS